MHVTILTAGPPPLYIGFGSMVSRYPARLVNIAAAALAQTEQRAVLLTGWSGLGHTTSDQPLPDNLFAIDSVPHHDWLFPQMVAVVHHGGAGTTAAGLRAGVPSILVPFFADQPFWAERLTELGVSPPPTPYKKLSASRLASAIRVATTNDYMRAKAATVGQQIRAEDGVGRAVAFFEQYVSKRGR